MKNLRLIITQKGYDILKAFADDNYLYSYVVNNSSELWQRNILNRPDNIKDFGEYIFVVKDRMNQDDERIIIESMDEIKRKNISYYAVILDTETREIQIYNNLSGKVNLPILNMPVKFDDFEIVKRLESFNQEIQQEEDMEFG
ncbi:MAG: hypothetical protein Q4G05_00315 [Clostridia bacterium]|nr:hypothetical protein [Clostridia bacterium]